MKKLLMIFILIFFAFSVSAETKVIHVTVALCDNKYQSIAKVPADLGNGQNPATNLYWGALYGVKTFFKKHGDWILVKTDTEMDFPIYERIVFKHKNTNTYMIADAYDGKYMKQTVTDFLNYSAGNNKLTDVVDSKSIKAGGDAGLVVFIGHNGLMDFRTPKIKLVETQDGSRDAAVFACKSRQYFESELIDYNITPLILTTDLMAPEAYNLEALARGWIAEKSNEEIKSLVAEAYDKYQKSGLKFANRLFATKIE